MESSAESRLKNIRIKKFSLHFSLGNISLQFSLHRPYTLPIPSRRTDGVTNSGISFFPSIPSCFLPPVEEVRPQHSIAHDAINLRTCRQHFYGRFVIGNKDSKCCYCTAIMWKEEKVENSSNTQPNKLESFTIHSRLLSLQVGGL